jgi:hypothetical protein
MRPDIAVSEADWQRVEVAAYVTGALFGEDSSSTVIQPLACHGLHRVPPQRSNATHNGHDRLHRLEGALADGAASSVADLIRCSALDHISVPYQTRVTKQHQLAGNALISLAGPPRRKIRNDGVALGADRGSKSRAIRALLRRQFERAKSRPGTASEADR